MASTYSSSLRFDLQGTGDNDGTWGTVANLDFTLIDAAIASVASIAMVNGNNTLSIANGTADQARCATLKLSGTLTSAAAVVIPDLSKQYVVYNGTTGGQVITVRNSAGTGITVPAGTAMQVWCDGTSTRPASPAVDGGGALVLTTLAADVGNIVDVSSSSINAKIGTFARINCSLTVSASAVFVNGQTNTSTLNVRGLATIVNMDATSVAASVMNVAATVSANTVKASTGTFTNVSSSTVNSISIVTKTGVGTLVSVPYAASVAIDFSLGNNFIIGALTGNLTLQNPTNETPGQSGSIFITQDATGGRTVTFGTDWLFENGTDPVLTSTSSARDVLSYFTTSTGAIYGSLLKDFR